LGNALEYISAILSKENFLVTSLSYIIPKGHRYFEGAFYWPQCIVCEGGLWTRAWQFAF